ncbi:hypothetical protein [Paenibacillus sp. UNC451MF]|uniref:hypothetical protein n=1 Tax=Paenibacillus sp. UNC451MF TaxID=1449063 RepID=UPI0004914552|nr:hypothetical protein [Paenibacillus sp. UNC451MF]
MKQPLTSKELDYIVDSMSNEDLLIKQCAVLTSTTHNPATHSLCMEMVSLHKQHYQSLMQSLHQHMQLAPMQPQTN